jgi:putative iron-regulated protein
MFIMKTKMMITKRLLTVAGVALALAALGWGGAGGCGSGSSSGGGGGSSLASLVVKNYADIALAAYQDSLAAAENLHDAVDVFVADPTEDNFLAAREAWIDSREPYEQTEAYRFYNGPIDGDNGNPEILINAWPLDEVYIDYVQGDANSGIVNDTSVDITEENLVELNGKDSEATLSTGYHAVEFLLWGQDLNADPEDTGLRAFTDFVDGGTNDHQDRRRLYLETVTHLLVENLSQVVDAWKTGVSTNYRAEFLSVSTDEALRRIIVGLGSFASGELAGQRISVALVTKDQEDEHSCFSDNTNRDLRQGFQSIKNIYFGTYTRTDGTSVGDGNGHEDLIEQADPTTNDQIKVLLGDAETALDGVDARAKAGVHFDQQIQTPPADPDHVRIQQAIDALNAFTDALSTAAEKLGIDINLDSDGA